ncbi:MAG: site-specific integrase [Actinomycetota bacterium]|nr:site-specific integrase [Actinomycetota bacterium]
MSGSTTSTPRPGKGRPEHPWLPANLHLWGVYSRERKVWVRNSRTGERGRRTRRCYDVRFHVDGHEFRFGFAQKGWADDFALKLQQDFAQGLLFDPQARRFVPLTHRLAAAEEDGRTFYDHACDYFTRQWHRWEPATRRNGQRDLATACVYLMRGEVDPLTADERVAAFAYLRDVALTVPAPHELTREQRRWEEWLRKWSLPLREITDGDLRAFIERIRTEALDGTKRRLADSSVARTRAVVRAAFTNARKRRLIDWDPWDGVESEPLRDHDKVDPDLVMDPPQVRCVARACGAIEARYEVFVLVQGLCGLRPGEATDLRRRDVDLADEHECLTFGGTRSEVPDRFFVEGESRRRPLKGRGPKARRTVPIPAELVPLLRWHLDHLVGKGANALVFTNRNGRPVNSSNFHRDIWSKARDAVFEEDSPLRAARRHDLRHSAITTWLNAGIPLKTAQRWSGHKTLSVLLDTYLGVMKADEEVARERFEAALNRNLVTGW